MERFTTHDSSKIDDQNSCDECVFSKLHRKKIYFNTAELCAVPESKTGHQVIVKTKYDLENILFRVFGWAAITGTSKSFIEQMTKH